MTISELEQVIQDYFMSIYHKKYIGKLYIQKLDPVGYYIRLGMDRVTQPTIIYAELPDNEFLKFLKQQIKDMRINLMYNGKLDLAYYPHQPTDCYDKG